MSVRGNAEPGTVSCWGRKSVLLRLTERRMRSRPRPERIVFAGFPFVNVKRCASCTWWDSPRAQNGLAFEGSATQLRVRTPSTSSATSSSYRMASFTPEAHGSAGQTNSLNCVHYLSGCRTSLNISSIVIGNFSCGNIRTIRQPWRR